jgi:integrase/recombinase XerD
VEILLTDLDAPLLLDFLGHLEKDRGNSVRTRNARLTAIRSFLHYASFRDVAQLPVIRRSLSIPMKRFDKPMLGYLSREERTVRPPGTTNTEHPPASTTRPPERAIAFRR